MSDLVTLETLITKCRERAEISSNYWSDTVLTRAINDAITEMWDRILAAPNGKDFLLRPSHHLVVATSRSGTGDSIAISGTTCTLTDAGGAFLATEVGNTIHISGCTNKTNNGTFIIKTRPGSTSVTYENAAGVAETTALTWSIDSMTVALPTDYGVDVTMVEVQEDDNTWRSLEPFNLHDRHDDFVSSRSQKVETRYFVMEDVLLLTPTPSWSGLLRVWYIPRPKALAATQSHNFFFGWDRFVINKVCQMHARARGEKGDADSFREDASIALDGILGRCIRRTPGAKRIRDVYGERRKNRYPQVS